MKVMVGGGFDDENPDSPNSLGISVLARHLGTQIVRQGHCLRSGNMTALDQVVIEGACSAVPDDATADDYVVSYTPKRAEKFTDLGLPLKSNIDDWNVLSGRRLRVPEPIEDADAVILIGGYDATYTAANWARSAGKPILPVASFGLAAEEIFADELASLKRRPDARVTSDEFSRLSKALSLPLSEGAAVKFSAEIVKLAERMALSRDVFVIMSFAEDEDLEQYIDTVQSVCQRNGFTAQRVDQKVRGESNQIIDSIHSDIAACAFVIADLTGGRPNVYYEIGFARGLGKPLLLTARKDVDVHFDLQGYQAFRWSTDLNLRRQLDPEVKKLSEEFGALPVSRG